MPYPHPLYLQTLPLCQLIYHPDKIRADAAAAAELAEQEKLRLEAGPIVIEEDASASLLNAKALVATGGGELSLITPLRLILAVNDAMDAAALVTVADALTFTTGAGTVSSPRKKTWGGGEGVSVDHVNLLHITPVLERPSSYMVCS